MIFFLFVGIESSLQVAMCLYDPHNTTSNRTYIYMWHSSQDSSHFTHEAESMWPLHFKHYQWWKRKSRSKFASHYAWGTNGVCVCKMRVKSTWIPTWHLMDHVSLSLGLFSKTTSGGRPNINPGDHSSPNARNIWFILFYHVWGPAWIRIHWNCIWLRVRSHMTSHYAWG